MTVRGSGGATCNGPRSGETVASTANWDPAPPANDVVTTECTAVMTPPGPTLISEMVRFLPTPLALTRKPARVRVTSTPARPDDNPATLGTIPDQPKSTTPPAPNDAPPSGLSC